MNFITTPLAQSYLIELTSISDKRGWFTRYYCEEKFAEIGHKAHWVQMNHSVNYQMGTLRGMHFQVPPFTEIKMVRCIVGKVFDVIIDLRKDSPTFLHWFGAYLSAKNRQMIYIPAGFAHGFQCMEDNCELLYHHSAFYHPDSERGIRYDDPLINVQWPLPVTIISEKDSKHQLLDKNFKGIEL